MAGLWSRLSGLWSGESKSTSILDELPALLRYPESKSGVLISPRAALEVSTVLACVRAIAEGVAQVPLRFYSRNATGGRTPLLDHPLIDTLARQPNPWQTSFEFRETVLFHLVLTGNAFVFKNVVGGKVTELIPIDPSRVAVFRHRDMSLTYQITFDDGTSPVLTPAEVWHIKGPSWNSWMGLEATKLAREAVGLAVSMEAAHARLHANGAQPGGVYSVEDKLQPAQYEQLRTWIANNLTGDNRFKPMILDRGAKWQSTAMTGVDAQHLETRKFQIEEICRHFRVNPLMVGYSDKTATFASAEQMFIAHVVHTITPWATRFEQSAEVHLLKPGENVEIRFHLNGLMRGAAADRAEYYAKALGSGGSPAWMTPNEVRDDDGLDWIEGGDELPKPPAPAPAAAPAPKGDDNGAV